MYWLCIPFFFICLYFIGVGGDENLKNYLAWPKYQNHMLAHLL